MYVTVGTLRYVHNISTRLPFPRLSFRTGKSERLMTEHIVIGNRMCGCSCYFELILLSVAKERKLMHAFNKIVKRKTPKKWETSEKGRGMSLISQSFHRAKYCFDFLFKILVNRSNNNVHTNDNYNKQNRPLFLSHFHESCVHSGIYDIFR